MPITYDNATQGFGNLASALLLAPQMAKRNRLEEEAARLHQQQMGNQNDYQNRALAQALKIHEDSLQAQKDANNARNEHFQREDSQKAMSSFGNGALSVGKLLANAFGAGPQKGKLTDNERYNLAIIAARHKAGLDSKGKQLPVSNADVDHYLKRIDSGMPLEDPASILNEPVYPAGVPKTAESGYLWNSNVPSAKDWNASNEPQEYHPRLPDGSIAPIPQAPKSLSDAMNVKPDDAETVNESGPGDEAETTTDVAPAAVPAVDPLASQILSDPAYQKKYGARLKDPATMSKIISTLKAAGH